jgi:adenylate kinase family enzyme
MGPVEPLAWDDPLPGRPRRVLVTGTSGSGKTTFAAALSARLDIPHTDIDGLFHGPEWVPRPEFATDVAALAARDEWVTEWQYSGVRALLLARAELLVWLDLTRAAVLRQVVPRTLDSPFVLGAPSPQKDRPAVRLVGGDDLPADRQISWIKRRVSELAGLLDDERFKNSIVAAAAREELKATAHS